MQRLQSIQSALIKEDIAVMEGDRLKVTDNRTGKSY